MRGDRDCPPRLRVSACKSGPWKRSACDEVHAVLAQGPSRHRRGRSSDRGQAHRHWPRSGIGGGRGRCLARLHGRPCRLRREASQCRQAEALHGRYRRRHRAGRLRRAQRAYRHEGCVRETRNRDSGQRRRAQGRHDPRHRIARHAVLGARALPLRRAHRHHRAFGRRGSWRAGGRRARPRRSGDRRCHHAQSRRLHERARHCTRPGRRRPRPPQGRQCARREGQLSLAQDGFAALPAGRGRGVSALRGPIYPRRQERAFTQMAAGPPARDRPQTDFGAGRRHQSDRL